MIPAQSFRPFVVDVMEPKPYVDRQPYPEGPPEPPYYRTGHELRLPIGFDADAVREPFVLPTTAEVESSN